MQAASNIDYKDKVTTSLPDYLNSKSYIYTEKERKIVQYK